MRERRERRIDAYLHAGVPLGRDHAIYARRAAREGLAAEAKPKLRLERSSNVSEAEVEADVEAEIGADAEQLAQDGASSLAEEGAAAAVGLEEEGVRSRLAEN